MPRVVASSSGFTGVTDAASAQGRQVRAGGVCVFECVLKMGAHRRVGD